MRKNPILLVLFLSLSVIPNSVATDQAKGEIRGIHCILEGDYPDPSILRDGDTYYMTHASFDAVPGLTIWESQDLLHWKRIAQALDSYVGTVWAPDLVKHNNNYLIYFPAGHTNYVIKSESIKGPWSDPVKLGIGGIDPGHIATPEGQGYLYTSRGRVYELAGDGLAVKGSFETVYEGWQYPKDWVVEGFCLESPKLTFRQGWYYLTSAQGGTAGPSTSHMVVSARARTPVGPWENSPHNPIIRTWDKSEQWWSKGHGTLVQSKSGDWFVVYHAYRNGHYPLGRSTLLEPIEWTPEGWFKTIRPPHREGKTTFVPNSQIRSDDFEAKTLDQQWQFSGVNPDKEIRLATGSVVLKASPDHFRMMYLVPTSDTFRSQITFEKDDKVELGLYLYYNSQARAGILVDREGIAFARRERTYRVVDVRESNLNPQEVHHLALNLNRYDLSTSFSKDGINWENTPRSTEVSSYCHNVLGGFSGLKLAIGFRGEGTLRIKSFRYEEKNR